MLRHHAERRLTAEEEEESPLLCDFVLQAAAVTVGTNPVLRWGRFLVAFISELGRGSLMFMLETRNAAML